MKVRDFSYKNPALCRDCNGSGILEDGSRCPTCNGTGKVWVTKEGTVTVTPYEG